jgi:hypothetical protein
MRPGPSTEFDKRWKRGRSVIYRVFITEEDYILIDADSPEDAMLTLRDAELEPVKAEPFPMQMPISFILGL